MPLTRLTQKKQLNSSTPPNHPVDIDIALSNLLGREFAEKLNNFYASNNMPEVKIGMVMKNPDKSKHLETATMKVGEYWIDFVNLRAEEYTSNSRIPGEMRIGTPHEDAYRRDLTINSLFFNLNTQEIEDFTGQGIQHLNDGIISTPLPPLTTLLDDPLRVLRAIRFAARLKFTMDDELRIAACDARVREALDLKVSRERIGSEIHLMLRSQDPVGAMRLIMVLNLAETVFHFKEEKQRGVNDYVDEQLKIGFENGLEVLEHAHSTLSEKNRGAGIGVGVGGWTDAIDERLLWYASFLSDFRNFYIEPEAISVQQKRQHEEKQAKIEKVKELNSTNEKEALLTLTTMQLKSKKYRSTRMTNHMINELKRPARDSNAISRIQTASELFTILIDVDEGYESARASLLGGITIEPEVR